MKRPLIPMLLFLVFGIIIGRYIENFYAIIPFIAVSIVCSVLLYLHSKKLFAFSLPAFLIIGIILIVIQVTPKSNNWEVLVDSSDRTTEVTGIVTDIAISKSQKQKITIAVETAVNDEVTSSENITLYAILDGETVSPGDRIFINSEISRLDTSRNPSAYDEFQTLHSHGIDYKTFPKDIEIKNNNFSINSALINLRLKAANIFDRILPKNSAIIKSMILGDKSGITDEIRQLYHDAGIYHILAISGLHVAILAGFLNFILKKLFIPKNIAAAITLIFLVVYCIFTGMGVATIRAVIMCASVLFATIFRRESDFLSSICLAAIVILVAQPMFLWDFGFLYSFIAVFGFALGQLPVDRFLNYAKVKINNNVVQKFFKLGIINKNLGAVLTAALATYPLSMYFFYDFPLIGLLNNLILVPTVVIVIAFGFAALIVGFFNVKTAMLLSGTIFVMLSIYEFICRISIQLPFAVIHTGQPPLFIIFMIYIVYGILIWVFGRDKYIVGEKKMKIQKVVCAFSVLLLIIISTVNAFFPRPLEITMLDVSQGDCIVGSKNGISFVIDGGGTSQKIIGTGTGTKILVPHLKKLGIKTLDAAFVTHTDADHATGIVELLSDKNIKIKKLFLPFSAKDDDSTLHSLLVENAKSKDTEIIYIRQGDELILDDVKISCLYPYNDTLTTDNANDSCIVLKVTYGDVSFMMTGDIGTNIEDELLIKNEQQLNSTVLKVAHHGSRYSSGLEFIQAVSPAIAIIGAGRNNSYGHPTQEVLERLENEDVAIYTTPENGAITIKTNGESLEITEMIAND